ncbi:MAG: hypothetical protein KDA99_13435 [Planctomycetales bacterium]|nr:hypothetical protein [Planctomycetales bacterium]
MNRLRNFPGLDQLRRLAAVAFLLTLWWGVPGMTGTVYSESEEAETTTELASEWAAISSQHRVRRNSLDSPFDRHGVPVTGDPMDGVVRSHSRPSPARSSDASFQTPLRC